MPSENYDSYPDQDSELWDNFRNGDQHAYTCLINKYSRPLFNYGYRICQDRDFLKDCIQEIFLELWNRRSRISATPSVKWYLFKAVRLRIFRDQSKWRRNELLSDDYDFMVEFNIESKIINEGDQDSLTSRIQLVLNHLPSRQREIIYLRFYENLDFDNICQIMNISKQSVHNLLQKAYKNFRLEWIFLIAFKFLSFLLIFIGL